MLIRKKKVVGGRSGSQTWWLKPVTLATEQAEIERITV
jgi:hypothetical protein